MDGRVRHDATLRTLAAELCDRGYGRAEGRREAEGCPDPAGAGGVRGQAHATELLPGRLKDEFYRNRTWRSFEEFKRDLDAYTVHWNKRRQVKQKGLTPEEFRNQSHVRHRPLIDPSKFRGAVHFSAARES